MPGAVSTNTEHRNPNVQLRTSKLGVGRSCLLLPTAYRLFNTAAFRPASAVIERVRFTIDSA